MEAGSDRMGMDSVRGQSGQGYDPLASRYHSSRHLRHIKGRRFHIGGMGRIHLVILAFVFSSIYQQRGRCLLLKRGGHPVTDIALPWLHRPFSSGSIRPP